MMLTDMVKRLTVSKRIGIITHIQPDGDAIGSSFALGIALKMLGKDVAILQNDDLPAKYAFLPGAHLLRNCLKWTMPIETLAVLDCADLERLGKGNLCYQNAETVLNIDHHISNTMFGNLNLVDTNAAATGELIYQMIKLLGIEIDIDIANCIFTAIVADTGCFKYDNTTAVTHYIAGELMSIGVEPNSICDRIFSLRTLPQTKMLGRAIDSISMYHGGKTAIMFLNYETIKKARCRKEDFEGLVEFARDIQGVKVAAFLRETEDGEIKVSIRSNEHVDTIPIVKHFGGGGHKKASGYIVNKPIKDAIKELVKRIKMSYD